jgi:hypothetical protein
MCEVIVQFDTRHVNFSYFASGQGKLKADTDRGERKQVHNIKKINFSHWEPPGVSERRRSVNFKASISGENRTLGGHSGWPSE